MTATDPLVVQLREMGDLLSTRAAGTIQTQADTIQTLTDENRRLRNVLLGGPPFEAYRLWKETGDPEFAIQLDQWDEMVDAALSRSHPEDPTPP